MKEKLYDIMTEYNKILFDIEAFVNVLEIELKGLEETYADEDIQSFTRVHLRYLKSIQEDSNKLYNKIDEAELSIDKRSL